MTFSHEDPEVSLVKETPYITASPGSFSKDDNSSSTIIDASTEFQDQVLPSSICLPNPEKALSGTQCPVVVTPDRNITMNTYRLMPEMESSLNLSVNSHTQKRRKSMGSLVIDLTQDEQSDVPCAKSLACTSLMRSSMANRDANRRIEFGFESNCAEQKSKKSNVSQSHSEIDYVASCVSSIPVMQKRLQISCSHCKSPLGLPENHLFVMCSLTSSSKVHLASLLKEKLKHDVDTPSVHVVMTETSSVHPELCTRTIESAPSQGIWCEEDGCVFNTIFCPFCSDPNNVLGVQIVATDSSNVQLLNKVSHFTQTQRTFYCA
jgi:Fanconi anemia group J protein